MAKKMTAAEKDAMHYLYYATQGKRTRRPRRLSEPSDRILDRLEDRGFIQTTDSGRVKLTPWGRNVAKVISGNM